jgi:ankyrin repeat protein
MFASVSLPGSSFNFDFVLFFSFSVLHLFPENNYGQRPLHTAASNGHVEAIHLLLKEGAAIDAKTRVFSLVAS